MCDKSLIKIKCRTPWHDTENESQLIQIEWQPSNEWIIITLMSLVVVVVGGGDGIFGANMNTLSKFDFYCCSIASDGGGGDGGCSSSITIHNNNIIVYPNCVR